MKVTFSSLNLASDRLCPFCNISLKGQMLPTSKGHKEDCLIFSEDPEKAALAKTLVVLWDCYWLDKEVDDSNYLAEEDICNELFTT